MWWLAVATFLLFVFPGVLGAIATAQTSPAATPGTTSANSALSFMDIRDSDGVEASRYFVPQDDGGLLNPGRSIVTTVTKCVMIGWGIEKITPIYLIGKVASFSWLDNFEGPLRELADSYTSAVYTLPVLLLGATLGSFFTVYFFVRGFYAKAAFQLMFLVVVAIAGPGLLANPMAQVFSSDGALAVGRDFGLAVSAGLNGEPEGDQTELVSRMQRQMADNFRWELQILSFGKIVDERDACRIAWSRGIESGDSQQVRQGMLACQDLVAVDAIDNPNWGQVGAGLVMMLASLPYTLCMVYMSYKIAMSVWNIIYNLILMILGAAFLAYIHGPPQVTFISNFFGVFLNSIKVGAWMVFLGNYIFLNGAIFGSPGSHMELFFLLALLHFVIFARARKAAKAMRRAEYWATNRFVQKLQNVGGKGGGGGGGAAFGMGGGPDGSSATSKAIGAFALLATVGNSTIASHLGRTNANPLAFRAGDHEMMRRNQAYFWIRHQKPYTASYRGFQQTLDSARRAVETPTLFHSARIPAGANVIGNMNAVSVIGTGEVDSARLGAHIAHAHRRFSGYGPDRLRPGLEEVGFNNLSINTRIDAAQNAIGTTDDPIVRLRRATDGFSVGRDAHSLGQLEQEMLNALNSVDVPHLPAWLVGHRDAYLANPTYASFDSLRQVAEGRVAGPINIGNQSVQLSADQAWQLESSIGYARLQEATSQVDKILSAPTLDPAYINTPLNGLRNQVVRMEQERRWAGGGLSPFAAAPPF
ncbi:hypothetical protein [Nocardia brasiliensis]|uniref:hypothetical protein n=1 Tax=Nocardia brasiliensis TaxID=37326 RepID=UPI003D9464E4